jgi:ABC-2 type transport system permease protein
VPIYEQSYRRHEARGPLRRVRFWPITREALRLVLARRAFLILLMMSWLPFAMRVIQVYVITRFPEVNRILPVDGRLFGDFLGWQALIAMFITIFAGAGLVANDLRTGAILVYLSRPLTRRDYVLGKLAVLLLLNLFITLVPALLLYLLALGLAPDQFWKWSPAWIGPAIVADSLVISAAVSVIALAISSLSRSARVAGIGFFGLLMGLEITRKTLYAVYGRPETALVSPLGALYSLGVALFDVADRAVTLPWLYAAGILALVAAGCLLVLRSRVRAVEIVQ